MLLASGFRFLCNSYALSMYGGVRKVPYGKGHITQSWTLHMFIHFHWVLQRFLHTSYIAVNCTLTSRKWIQLRWMGAIEDFSPRDSCMPSCHRQEIKNVYVCVSMCVYVIMPFAKSCWQVEMWNFSPWDKCILLLRKFFLYGLWDICPKSDIYTFCWKPSMLQTWLASDLWNRKLPAEF